MENMTLWVTDLAKMVRPDSLIFAKRRRLLDARVASGGLVPDYSTRESQWVVMKFFKWKRGVESSSPSKTEHTSKRNQTRHRPRDGKHRQCQGERTFARNEQ